MCQHQPPRPPMATASEASWSLAHELSDVRLARQLTRGQLREWSLADQTDIAELLVSELVTNAVCHGAGPVRLTLTWSEGIMRCAVADADPRLPHPHPAEDEDEGGRGLHLVEQLSSDWGAQRTTSGKSVWFKLTA